MLGGAFAFEKPRHLSGAFLRSWLTCFQTVVLTRGLPAQCLREHRYTQYWTNSVMFLTVVINICMLVSELTSVPGFSH